MEQLSERQNTILRGVIETHIETSLPVGSRYVGEKCAFSFSPATIRNEMGILEEIGYLTHPHISSGRIPTDHGYRYYLDHTCFDESLKSDPLARVAQALVPAHDEEQAEDFIDRVSLVLSSLSQEIGLTLMPFEDSKILAKIERLKLSLQGLTHLLEKPEFQDVHKIKSLLRAFEEKVTLAKWLLEHANEEQVSVSVGSEHENEALEDCAIVMVRYSAGRHRKGAIAILGPKRMPYRQVIPLVSSMAVLVGNILERMENKDL
ncbi:MAG TPA: hypothetical protein PLO78_05415 [Candidatus Omnitrophota bacterium]|nr:hypothetical protein [Candidatus Omnitrophota bacterium]